MKPKFVAPRDENTSIIEMLRSMKNINNQDNSHGTKAAVSACVMHLEIGDFICG